MMIKPSYYFVKLTQPFRANSRAQGSKYVHSNTVGQGV
jgi:hypothetical protein